MSKQWKIYTTIAICIIIVLIILTFLPANEKPKKREMVIQTIIATETVRVTSTPTPTPTPTCTPTPAPLFEQCGLSEDEFEFFARVVQAEAGNHEEGQKWVAAVIWNRVNDDGGYGGSVTHVLTAFGQFSTVKKGDCKTKATDGARIAIVTAYTDEIIPVNVLYFRSGYAFAGHRFYDECGGNYFSYG